MTPYLLIFITFLLALLDKAEMFKRPIKWNKIGILILLIISCVTSFINQQDADNKQDADANKISNLHGQTTVLTNQIDTLRKDNKIAQKNYEDSLIAYHLYITNLLAGYGLKVDTLQNVIEKFDTAIKKEIPPTLTILNPPTIELRNNERVLNYTLHALNANAHVLDYTYIFINTHNLIIEKNTFNEYAINDKPVVVKGNSLNFTSIVVPGQGQELTIFLDRDMNLSDTFVLAMEFLYKSKGNIRQTPLRKMFLGVLSNKSVYPASSFLFYEFSLFLQKEKIWETFYDL